MALDRKNAGKGRRGNREIDGQGSTISREEMVAQTSVTAVGREGAVGLRTYCEGWAHLFDCNRSVTRVYVKEWSLQLFCKSEMIFLKDFIYLLLERGEGERGPSMCGCLLRAPYWGPGPQPRLVPCVGIKPATLWFAGRCSIHWATPARAQSDFKITSVKETLKWS